MTVSAGTQKIQAGLPPETQAFWRAVATAFPHADALGSWGDQSHAARRSDHNKLTTSGKVGPRALDIMTGDAALHARIVAWLLLHREEYGVSLIISRRRKWSAASNWQPRPYLGTSGHFDHVHASNDGVPKPKSRGELLVLPDGRVVRWEGAVLSGERMVVHIHTEETRVKYKLLGYPESAFPGPVNVTGAER